METRSGVTGSSNHVTDHPRAKLGSRVAGLALVVAGLGLAWSLHASGRNTLALQADGSLTERVEAVLSAMKDLETGERGYLLTGNDAFLQPYYAAQAELAHIVFPDDRDASFTELRRLIDTKRDAAEHVIMVRRTQGLDAAASILTSGDAKLTMDATRAQVGEIKAMLADRITRLRRRDRSQVLVASGAFFVAATAACGWFALLALSRRRKERTTNALLEGVMRNAPIGLGFLDRDLRVRHLNHALVSMSGPDASAHVGQAFLDLLPAARDRLGTALGEVVHHGHSVSDLEVEVATAARPGAPRSCLVSLYPLRRHEMPGQIDGAGVLMVDVTIRKRAEAAIDAARQAAEEANQAKSTFIANMSHELRTPLSAIIGYSEMLREEMEDLPAFAAFGPDMHKIEGNARHLLGLINDVLDLSKIESGKMEVYAETFAIADILHEVAATMQGLIAKKGNRFQLEIATDLGQARSDATKLRQILLNLLSNAAKFTVAGLITLQADVQPCSSGPVMVFRVIDTGIGMTEEQLAKLFQRFRQAEASTSRNFGGTGLGLSIAKAFSLMLGGDITVQSQPGEGTTFIVTLPVTILAEKVAETSS